MQLDSVVTCPGKVESNGEPNIRRRGNMENHKEQLNLFTEKDSEPRNTEQAKPSKPEPGLS